MQAEEMLADEFDSERIAFIQTDVDGESSV
jgi:hypothetical protein